MTSSTSSSSSSSSSGGPTDRQRPWVRAAVAAGLALGAVGVGALLARAASTSDDVATTNDRSTAAVTAGSVSSDDVFTSDPTADDPAAPPATATTAPGDAGDDGSDGDSTSGDGTSAPSDGSVDATTDTPAPTEPPATTAPTTVPPTTVPPTTEPPLPAGAQCGPATIDIGELIDASTQPHERPIPVVPDNWSFALGPTADEGVGNPIDPGSRFMNPWNHIYEGTGTVEMGRACVAIRQNGEWTVHDFGPMCVAIQTDDFGTWAGPDAGECDDDVATYVVDPDPAVFTHGWPGSGWAEIIGGSGTIEYVLSWGAARGDGSLYHCGVDRRNRGETGVITPMAHGRAFVLGGDWRACIAHNMDEAQVVELCRAGAFPASFPLVGGCERS